MAEQTRLPRSAPPPSEELADDDWISHYGREQDGEPAFHKGPRPQDAGELSMIRGKRGAQEAAQMVMPWKQPPFPDAVVRYARVGWLREAGFTVEHTPSKLNCHHVSIYLPDKPHTWAEEAMAALEECFEDGEGGRDDRAL